MKTKKPPQPSFHVKGLKSSEQYSRWFLLHLNEIGMNADDIGKEFTYNKRTLTLVGLGEKKNMLMGKPDRGLGLFYVPIQFVKDRLAGIPEPIPEPTEWEKRYAEFKSTYNDQTITSTPFRCCDQTDGYYTRKDGTPCTEADVERLYEIRSLGQETRFTLEDGRVKVYGFCDHGD
jgi:hypothetical protein